MNDATKPLFSVKLSPDFEFAPRKIEDLIENSSAEVQFWSWLESNDVKQANVVLPLSQILQPWRHILQHATAWQKAPLRPEHHDQVIGQLNVLRDARAPTRLSEDGQIIEQIRQSIGPVAAGAAAQFCMNRSIEPHRNDHLKGAVAFCTAKVAKVPIADAAMRRLADEFGHAASSTLHKMESDRATAIQMLTTQVAKALADNEIAQTQLQEGFAKTHAENDNLRAKLKQEFEDFKKFYAQGIALQGPVEYWTEKRKRHRANTIAALGAFALYLGVAVIVVDYFVHQTRLSDMAFWKEAGYGLIGMVAVGAGVLIAIGRLVLRLVMSQLHLGNDADERVTMVKTFLALREGGHADAKSLEIVLTRLFAPTADGIVRDDIGPVSPVEALASRLTGKS